MADPNERRVPKGYELDMYESREWRVDLKFDDKGRRLR